MMITDTYTSTLSTGRLLTVTPQVSLGEMLVMGALLLLLAALVLNLGYRLVYRQ